MLSVRFRKRDRHPKGALARLLTAEEAAADPFARLIGFAGRADEVAAGRDATGRLVVLAGLGARADAASVRAAAGRAAGAALGEKRLVLDARGFAPELAAEAAVGASLRGWRFDRLKTRPDPDTVPPRLKHLEVVTAAKRDAGAVWETLSAGVAGTLLARDLVSEPANRLTPTVFAARLRGLAEEGLEVEIRDRDWLARRGFGAMLGVARGSANPPCLAVLRWKGTIDRAPIAFVGKGVTFDTGGVDLKPAERMWEMRADMAGAAACAGAMLALARRRSPCPAVAVLGLVENMIGSEAQRPSDVVRAVNGTTIEVIDTDAEGRLVLADCLAWTRLAYAPAAIIDLATLTGSIVVALGNHRAGMFASDAALAAHLAAAAEAVDEPVWPMPLDEAYAEALKSEIADVKNCVAERFQPDACHAAIFLKRFAADTPWVHLDIAGVDLRAEDGDLGPAGATGFGVRLLDRLVALRFEDADA
ncbi:leucyl aminopeptidase [Elioraea thermophila]|uniref:leucyl aminopeptidase n=1 Tax=Elioraea thermophila TaxID=2185104 RepID=UPI000DF1A86B|nr:leucyl aminopeptidase [Elioraea thermophila]